MFVGDRGGKRVVMGREVEMDEALGRKGEEGGRRRWEGRYCQLYSCVAGKVQ